MYVIKLDRTVSLDSHYR